MKSLICAALVAYGLAAAGHAAAQADLAKKDGCTNCHDVATKKVGPSFKDIAAKYKGNASAETHLIVKISTGTSPESAREAGVHPQVKASKEDVRSLVKWILSM